MSECVKDAQFKSGCGSKDTYRHTRCDDNGNPSHGSVILSSIHP